MSPKTTGALPRVGIDYRTALINREGIGRYTRELVRAYVELGCDEGIGLFGWTLAPMKFTRAELGLEGARARLTRFRFPSRWMPDLFRTLGRGADDIVGGCDVFHHTQPHLLPVRQAIEVATVFDCIYTLNEPWLSPEAATNMTEGVRAMIARSKRVFVPTAYVAGDVARTFGVPRERISVTLLGCDHVLRGLASGESAAPRGPYVLTVSRVDARKNHVRMLHAFERLVAAGFPQRWIIAGPPGYGAADFELALAASPARERVEWLRFESDARLPRLYAEADLFLFASLNEGFGLPPLEAMACGAPVVASNTTSMPEVLGDAATLVDPLDEDAIFEAARAVLADRDLSRALVERGRARAAELTWKACAAQTLAAYAAARRVRARGLVACASSARRGRARAVACAEHDRNLFAAKVVDACACRRDPSRDRFEVSEVADIRVTR